MCTTAVPSCTASPTTTHPCVQVPTHDAVGDPVPVLIRGQEGIHSRTNDAVLRYAGDVGGHQQGRVVDVDDRDVEHQVHSEGRHVVVRHVHLQLVVPRAHFEVEVPGVTEKGGRGGV